MADVQIEIREHGPYLVSGPVTLTDADGNSYDLTGKDKFALCRCGESQSRPFCDGTHKTCNFQSSERAPAS